MRREGAHGEVFNIGSTDEITIGALAEEVRRAARSASEITLVPYDEAYEQGFEDMQRRIPDISKIGALLGWGPTRDLAEILSGVISFEREGGAATPVAQLG